MCFQHDSIAYRRTRIWYLHYLTENRSYIGNEVSAADSRLFEIDAVKQ